MESKILLDYNGEDLKRELDGLTADKRVIQILPTSTWRFNERTGLESRDYLLIFSGS